MDDDLAKLLVEPDDPIRASWWNDLVKAVARRTVRRGRGVRTLQLPENTIVRFDSRGAGASIPLTPFRVSITTAKDGSPAVTFSKGLIAGVEPQIDGKKVSFIDPATDEQPKLKIDPAKDIDPITGIGFVYAELQLDKDYSILKIVPVAFAKPPPITEWRGYKLIAFLRRTPAGDLTSPLSPLQQVWFNLGHTTSQRFGGKARHWFWAQ